MRRQWIIVTAVCLAALPVLGGDPEAIDKTDEQKDPHLALREAVEDIRTHYAPNSGVLSDFVYRSDFNRPRLGVVLRSGAYVPHGEGKPGAEILAVTPGSPADEAGLQPGDVIVAWNGELLAEPGNDPHRTSVEAARELAARSHELEPGDAVTLRYLRDDRELEATLVAREIDFSPRLAAGFRVRPDVDVRIAPGVGWQSAEPWFIPRGWLDMELVSINPELGAYFGSDTGVLVVRGPADDDVLGLQSGDVILRIGSREVKDPEHAMRILRSYEPEEELSIDIIRHERSQTLTGTVPESSFRFRYGFRSSGD